MLGVEMERPNREHRPDASAPRVHLPVLATEVTRALGGERPEALEGWIADATLGAGGRAALALAAHTPAAHTPESTRFSREISVS